MIARFWRARADSHQGADSYQAHFSHEVISNLAQLGGFKGARLLRRETDGGTEFAAITLWDSMDAVRGFAGERPAVAVVDPLARTMLSEFDPEVAHYQIVVEV